MSALTCELCREAISARLDGEDLPVAAGLVDEHLASCGACRRFEDDAARVTRLARIGIALPGPDLVENVLACAPSRSRRVPLALRAGLVAVAIGQLSIALYGLLIATGNGQRPHGGSVGGAGLTHLTHESSAWNLALGAGFLWVALRAHRTTGLVPVLGVFVGVLTLVSAADLVAGRVDSVRVLLHGLIVIGLVLVLLLDRHRVRGGSAPGAGTRRGARDIGSSESVPDPAPGHDRTGLRPTAHHRAA